MSDKPGYWATRTPEERKANIDRMRSAKAKLRTRKTHKHLKDKAWREANLERSKQRAEDRAAMRPEKKKNHGKYS